MAKKPTDSGSISAALSKYSVKKEFDMIPLSVDVLNELWGGGMVLGYMYSLWAPPGVGKSTLAIQAAKSFCKKDLKVLYIDVEKAVNEFMMKSFDLEQYEANGTFARATVTNFAEWEDLCMLAADEFDLIITDSETAITPVTPVGLRVTDVRPGLRAQQESFVMNKLKDLFYKTNTASIILFHARANINIMGGGTQPTEKQAGGFAAEHYPDVVTKLTAHAKIKGSEDEIVGNFIRITTTKNKFTAPFITKEKKLIFGVGISKRVDLVDTALEKKLITQSGAFFILPDGSKVKGRQAVYNLPAAVLSDIQKRLADE